MSAGKTIAKLGEMAAIASTAKAIVEFMESREQDNEDDFEIDSGEHIKNMLDYLGNIITDIRNVHK